MVTFSLIFYCCVGIIMIDEQKCPILFSGPGYLEWIPCDYNECIAATTLACVPNSLPYVVAQACVASTIFRLPFIHVVILVFVVTVFYVGSSVVFATSSLTSITAAWELCPLFLAFFCLVLASQRGEHLSRYLFIHLHPRNRCNKTVKSKTIIENVHDPLPQIEEKADDKAGCLSVSSASNDDARSSSYTGSSEQRRKGAVHRAARKLNHLVSLFVEKFFSDNIFMSFERKIIHDTGDLCRRTIEFKMPEMEYCFLSGRLEISNKYAFYSLVLIFFFYAVLTFDDVTKLGLPAEQKVFGADMVHIVRIAIRCVFCLVATVAMCLNYFMKDIYFRAYCLLVGTFVFLVISLVSDPEYLERIVGADGCEDSLAATIKADCATRKCFSMVAFLTAFFSWVLVQLRMKFHHVWATLFSVCLLFILLGFILNVHPTTNDLFCLVFAAVSFTIGAYRVDVTARVLFYIEWTREETEGAKKKVTNQLATFREKQLKSGSDNSIGKASSSECEITSETGGRFVEVIELNE